MIFVVYAQTHAGTERQDFGLADYSYHFVLESFRPVLERLGTVVQIFSEPQVGVDAVYDVATHHGERCLFLSFTPPHKTLIHLRCPTVCVFAWEYLDLPRTMHRDVRDDWAFVLRSLGSAITHSESSARLVRECLGPDYPIAVLKAPLFDDFARAPGETPAPRLERQIFEFRGLIDEAPRSGGARTRPIGTSWTQPTSRAHDPASWQPSSRRYRLELEGIVYLAVFNPADGRKNWRELLTCFALALGDRPDATLVLKTIRSASDAEAKVQFRAVLEQLGPLRCRILLIDGYLERDTYRRLVRAATYSVNASRGEGQCLPLMEAMAAGRPVIAPHHTGMSDYLDATNSFCVESTLEPASFPHDETRQFKTWRHRIDARSLFEAYRESYGVASGDPERYREMAESARASLERQASREACEASLRSFLSRREEADLPTGGVPKPGATTGSVAQRNARDSRVDIDRAFRQQVLRLNWTNRQRRNPRPASERPSGPVDGVPLHFILAGFAKCGTTSLTALLGGHPDLYIRREEFWHFTLGFDHADEHFRRFFATATPGERLGLCGVSYSSRRDEDIARETILHHYPDIRLLFLARCPLARLESAFREYHHSWHRTAAGMPPFEVNKALEENPILVEDCQYGARLAHYADQLPRENVHVLFFEDLLQDPAAVLRECYSFLDVDASVHVPQELPLLNSGRHKLRDTEELRAQLDVMGNRQLAMALRVLSLEERDQFAVPLGLREPHPAELAGWDVPAQRRFARQIEPDIQAFLKVAGRDLEIWPRFAALCDGGVVRARGRP